MMPGSRPDELRRHFPIILDAFRALLAKYPRARGVVAATSEPVAALLRSMAVPLGGWPDELRLVVRDTDAVIRWCDVAIVKSGTVTLQVARQRRPMVVFYRKSNPFLYLVFRLILSTRYFSLPNVLAQRRVIPEFIPHYGGAVPIVQAVERLIDDPQAADAQRQALESICRQFDGHKASELAADSIEDYAGLARPEAGYKSRVQ
jgi:lipid-A-disaccharide synthase